MLTTPHFVVLRQHHKVIGNSVPHIFAVYHRCLIRLRFAFCCHAPYSFSHETCPPPQFGPGSSFLGNPDTLSFMILTKDHVDFFRLSQFVTVLLKTSTRHSYPSHYNAFMFYASYTNPIITCRSITLSRSLSQATLTLRVMHTYHHCWTSQSFSSPSTLRVPSVTQPTRSRTISITRSIESHEIFIFNYTVHPFSLRYHPTTGINCEDYDAVFTFLVLKSTFNPYSIE